tara:strand:- start:850 stop:2037 length:1188 start_codon:yes stop_codon:yes gene_type:complete
MKELVINSTTQHTLLLFVPMIIAAVLRIAKIRGSSIIGGVLGGILLGPAMFGSFAPEYWEGIFLGGEHEHKLVAQLEQQQKMDIESITQFGTSDVVIMQFRADQQYELDQAITKWKAAQWRDQRTLRNYVLVLVIIVLLSGSLRRTIKAKSNTATSLTVGVWAALIPGGIIAVASHYLWATGIASSLAMGACLAAGPWTFSRWEQKAADDSEDGGASLMLRCGYVSWTVASIAAFYSAWTVQGAMSLVWLLPLLLLPMYWLLPKRDSHWLQWFADYAAIPSIAATAMVLIHPIGSLSFLPILLVVLISSDGRWLGGMVGLLILGGRTSANAMRITMPLVDAGASQLCMAAMLFGVGVLSEELTLAAISGAIFIELTAPTRRKFATSIKDNLLDCD